MGNPFSWIDERAALEARIDDLERSLDAALEDNEHLRGEVADLTRECETLLAKIRKAREIVFGVPAEVAS